MALQLKTNNDTFKCGLHLTVRVCTTKRFFSEHAFIKISYCVFKIMMLKMKKRQMFLDLCGLSTESFFGNLAVPVQVSYNRVFFMKKVCRSVSSNFILFQQ